MSTFYIKRDHLTGTDAISFSGSITKLDMVKLQLSPADRMFLESCDQGATAADKLLGLELLFRRMQEQGITPSMAPQRNGKP